MQDKESIEGRIAQAAADAVMERLAPLLQPLLDTSQKHTLPTPSASSMGDGKMFLTLAEAAEVLGVHKSTLLRHECNNRLPPRSYLGAKTGWHRFEIEHFLTRLPKRRPSRQGSQSFENGGGAQ